ncbi:primosomal replication protein [Vibrio hannami]|uniref:primosomal replication protein n=1 Tax=Vibrio hannami TaxID=2717094 RepID=UPI00240F3FC7|nr:primosomal replication protein [Vibrio hannami]MDG3087677.1 primosomal replication protein [Vibrio hannami]
MSVSFLQLTNLLEQLTLQAEQLDGKRGEHHHPLFDDRLFSTRSMLLTPYVDETRNLVVTLINEKDSGQLTPEHAEYLTDKLLDQISAIQLELNTQELRKSEAKPRGYYKKPICLLYQDLAQHQEWERRLKELVRAKEKEAEQAPPTLKPQALKALINAEKRLERCIAAKANIEKQIYKRERKQ